MSIETALKAPPRAGVAADALARAGSVVVPALEATLPRLSTELRTSVGEHLLSGGKHVRAGLALVSAAACGAEELAALDGAVAIELVHNFSLVHDDIIDNDVERRHRPTLWSDHGVSHAIIAGDALAIVALQVLLDRPTPERARAAGLLADATQSMISGQMLDMAFERRETVGLSECIEMVVGKTGALLKCASQLGAVLGGASEAAIDALGVFGLHLGIAFQAIDDVLGIWGDPDVTGKPVGSDLRRHKMTLPICIARAEGVELDSLGRPGHEVSDEDVAAASAALEACGARHATLELGEQHLAEALGALDRVPLAREPREQLVAIADYVVARDR
jgi:geranylgeranyl diphosphate synthase type I